MKNQFLILILLMLLWNSSLLAGETDNRAIFNEGIGFFEKGDLIWTNNPDSALILYKQAVNRFEFLAQKRNIQSGWLSYNLGNSYFRAGELGQAIYHYRKAQACLPYNKDLKNNLYYTQSLVQDGFEKNAQSGFIVFIEHVKSVPSWIKGIILLLTSTFFFVLLSPPLCRRIPLLYKGLAGTLYSSVVLTFMLAVLHNPLKGIILKDNVIAKKGNSLVYEDAFYGELHQGTEFKILEHRGAWIKGELPDGKLGWFEAVNVGIVE